MITDENRSKIEEAVLEAILAEGRSLELLYEAIMFGRQGLREMTLEELKESAEVWAVDVEEMLS